MLTSGFKLKVHEHGHVQYVESLGSDMSIVEAARVSYGAPSKGPIKDRALLNYLLKNRHMSPFEMCKITFNVKMPIFVMRQWVRHRMQNLNEVSARYTELPEEMFMPAQWRAQDTVNKQGSVIASEWDARKHKDLNGIAQTSYAVAWRSYQDLLSQGVAKELARVVLPVGIYTEIRCCFDLRNFLHFLSLRDDSHAQQEIRDYAQSMRSIATMLFPWTLAAYGEMEAELADFKVFQSDKKKAAQAIVDAGKIPGAVPFVPQAKL